MALVRVLVDGYSLLHQWPELASGRPRHSESARDELVQALTQYHDLTGLPVTVFFDGASPKTGPLPRAGSREVEVLFSRGGQSADQMIERAARLFLDHGEVLVVTDDHLERDTVAALGGMVQSCDGFVAEFQQLTERLQKEVRRHNVRERHRFNRSRKP